MLQWQSYMQITPRVTNTKCPSQAFLRYDDFPEWFVGLLSSNQPGGAQRFQVADHNICTPTVAQSGDTVLCAHFSASIRSITVHLFSCPIDHSSLTPTPMTWECCVQRRAANMIWSLSVSVPNQIGHLRMINYYHFSPTRHTYFSLVYTDKPQW